MFETFETQDVVLAQNGTLVNLVVLPERMTPSVDDQFTRDPQLHKSGDWTIIKVFQGDARRQISSLIGLIGLPAVSALFQYEIREVARA